MRNRSGKVFIGKRQFLLEQLEERIVFDAAGSADANQENSDTHDTSAATDTGESDPLQADDAAAAADASSESVDPLGDVFDQHLNEVLITNVSDVIESATDTQAQEAVNVLVISSSVENADQLASAAQDDVVTIVYDGSEDTPDAILAAVQEALDGREALSIAFAVHDLGEGCFHLTSGYTVSPSTILSDSELQDFWAGVGYLLTDDGRIDIMACDLASTDAGDVLVSQLENLTGRDVAASDDPTGNPAGGGDWILETDDVDLASIYFVQSALDDFDGTLAAEDKLTADDGASDDYFGYSVAVDGNYCIVGAYGDGDCDGDVEDWTDEAGAVYIYELLADGTWGNEFKITASDGARYDEFGWSVSISGDYCIVGAWGDDDDDIGQICGSVYIYEHLADGTWGNEQKITASDAREGDLFGQSVSIDGDYCIVGAYGDDNSRGSVYIYEHLADGTWGNEQKITASHRGTYDYFGYSVSIDGDYCIVGAYQDDDNGDESGSVYIYEHLADGTWGNEVKITAGDGAKSDYFGKSVSIDGDYCIVGAWGDDDDKGSVYIYELDEDTGIWGNEVKLTASDGAAEDYFGYSVSIDGDYCIVAAYLDDDNGSNSGSVYIYELLADGTWGNEVKITASDGAKSDLFGYSVSIEGDYCIVGAYYDDDNGSDSGSAYVYDLTVPTLDLDASSTGTDYAVTFTAGGAAVDIADDDMFVLDSDSTSLVSAKVTLTNRPDGEEESLSLSGALPGSLTLTDYDPSTGVLVISGTGTKAEYEAAIELIQYNNTTQYAHSEDRVIEVQVNDGSNSSNIAVSTITVEVVNYDPTAVDDDSGVGISTERDTSTTFDTSVILANDEDLNPSDTVSVTSVSGTSAAGALITLDTATKEITYDPNGQFDYLAWGESAVDTFTYTITDGNGGTATATVTVTVTGSNYDPVAEDDDAEVGITTDEDTSTTFNTSVILANDHDPDVTEGDAFSVTSVSATSTAGALITLDTATKEITYDPNGQFDYLTWGESAVDTFTYTITDGYGATDTATVTVTVTAANHDPTAVDDDSGVIVSTDEETTATFSTSLILANDGDADGDTVSVTSVSSTSAAGGLVTWDTATNKITYDTNGKFDDLAEGETAGDTFTYTITDGHGGYDTATVTVTITNTNHNVASADESKLTADDGTMYDEYGYSVSIDGKYAIVGALKYGSYSGSVYIYEIDADGTWGNEQKITASDADTWDYFGCSVCISGDYLIVGAYLNDDDNGSSSGSVYIYEHLADGTWGNEVKIIASDGSSWDYFGYSVSIDGEYCIVGTEYYDRVYIYELQSDGTWDNEATITGSGCFSVSIDGNYAIVGAYGDDDNGGDSGAVYIYELDSDTGTWEYVTKITASDGAAGDYFGASVSIDGDYVVVGAYKNDDDGSDSGSVYIYELLSDGTWGNEVKIIASDGSSGDYFGYSVSIDGDYVVVGAYGDDDNGSKSGSVYIYELQADGTWGDETKWTPDDGAADDYFGCSVSISGDYALVGAYGDDDKGDEAGSAYIFYFPEPPTLDLDASTDGTGYTGTFTAGCGAVNIAGDDVSITDQGDPYLESVVVTLTNPLDGEDEGLSLSGTLPGSLTVTDYDPATGVLVISGTGTVAEYEAAIELIQYYNTTDFPDAEDRVINVELSNGHDTSNIAVCTVVIDADETKVIAGDGGADDRFGYSVSVDGKYAVVGAYGDDDNGEDSGSTYIYEIDADGNWTNEIELTETGLSAGDYFGFSVSISGDYLVIGAYGDDDNGTDSGAVYIYELQADGTWGNEVKLTAGDGAQDDHFGSSVSMSGDYVIIGAYGDDDNGNNSGSVYIYGRDADGNWTIETKLIASDGAAGDGFGYSVAIDGDYAIVGAYEDDDNGTNSGSVYIYERDADGNWTIETKLTASDGEEYDYFGRSVAIDGNYAVVGAHGDDDNGGNSGSVYIYERGSDGTWGNKVKLIATDGSSNDRFGISVSIDGDYCIVGAHGDDDNGNNSGSVYIYAHLADGTWGDESKWTAADGAAGDYFGYSVSISQGHAAVGAFGDDGVGDETGSAYIISFLDEPVLDLDASAEGTGYTTTFTAGGGAVDIADDDVSILSPDRAYLESVVVTLTNPLDGEEEGLWLSGTLADGLTLTDYDPETGVLVISGTGTEAEYEAAIELIQYHNTADYPDGEDRVITVAVDDGYNTSEIAVSTIEIDPGDEVKLIADDGDNADRYGYSVSIDGNYAIVGAYRSNNEYTDDGCVYIYEIDADGNWTNGIKLTATDGWASDYYGYSVCISGDYAVVGAYGDDDKGGASGSVYIYERNADGIWEYAAKLTASDGEAGDTFGYSVSIDGDHVIVGSYYDDNGSGSVYIYERSADGIWGNEIKLTATDPDDYDYFGHSVSISGNYAIVGAYGNDDDGSLSGSVYIYELDADTGTWGNEIKLTATDAAAGDYFGCSVSIDGNYAVVGAFGDDDNGGDSGSVYIYELDADTGTWGNVTKITASDGSGGDQFGRSVSVDDGYVVVGSNRDDDNGGDSGSVYIYGLDADGNWTNETKWTPKDGAAGDYCGYSVSISGDYALVGAYGDDDNGSESGSAYLIHWTSPTVDLDESGDGTGWQVTFAVGYGAVDIADDDVLITDGDSTVLESVVVTLTNRPDCAEEGLSLSGDLPGTLTVTEYDPDTGRLVISGTGTLAEYQAAIALIQYNNGATSPDTADRFIEVTVSDGQNESNIAICTVGIDPGNETKLNADDSGDGDHYGYSVSIDGKYVIVGANQSDNEYTNDGCVYIYEIDAYGNWTNEIKLTASDGEAYDYFGYSVSISGDYCIVGAYGDDDNGSFSGSVYIYELDPDTGTWGNEVKITATDAAANDYFGYSVSISGDYAIVGSCGENDEAGSVYIYELDADTGTWGNEVKITATDAADGEFFGYSVSISGDYCIVGRWQDDGSEDSGSVYIYELDADTGTWGNEVKVTATDGAPADHFGSSVSIDGNYAIVGAWGDDDNGDESGSVYIYELDADTGTWGNEVKLATSDGSGDDRYGYSVSMDGEYVIVGARYDDDNGENSGSVYIYGLNADGTWGNEIKLTASDGSAGDYFGCSVSISGDYALVGAYGDDDNGTDSGSAYLIGWKAPRVDLDESGDGTGYDVTFEVGGAAVDIADDDVLITDTDSTILESAVVALANRPDGADEGLSLTGDLPGSLTVTDYDPETGRLVISGTGTLAEYQAAIELIQYNNTAASPDMADRTIQVTVSDGQHWSNVAVSVVSFVVASDDPIAEDDSGAITEPETTYTTDVLITDTDTDYADLSVEITGTPSGTGTLSHNGDGTFTYTYTGGELSQGQVVNESFTYTVEDIDGSTVGGTVTVTVTGVNDDPVAADDAYNVTEDSPVSGNVISDTAGPDSDVDGDSLTATLVSGPAYGTLTEFNSDGSFTYVADDAHWDTLAADETEDVTFTYQISDGKGGTDTATVTITVTGTNDDPAAADDAYDVTEDSSVSGNVITHLTGQDSDVEGDSLTATLVTGPAYGTLTEFNSDGSFTYVADDDHWDTLAAGATEDVTFTYEISDGKGGTDTATVTITVTGTNDDPTAEDDDGTIAKPTTTYTTGVLIDDVDTDLADLTVTVPGSPSATGTLTYNDDGTFTYTYTGPELSEGEQVDETFTYTVKDTEGATDNGTITVTVTGDNLDPSAADDSGAITEPETTYSTGVLITDPDTDFADLVVAIGGSSSTGTLSYNGDGTFTYTYTGGELAQGQVVNESFTYTVTDTDNDTAVGTITVTVTGVNDDPEAANDAYNVTEDSSVSGNVITDTDGQDSDVEGDSLTATLVSGPAYGTLTEFNSDGSFTYVADDPHWDSLAVGATEDVTFTYEISDGHGGTDTATVTITVTGTNDDPVAADDAYNVTEDSSMSGNVVTDTAGQDSDVDGDSLTATLLTGPTYGTLTEFNSDGSFTYVADDAHWDTLAAGETEDVTFTYTLSDGKGGTDTATVTITVTGTNDYPVAADDAYNVTEDLSVSGNVITDTADSDIDGDSLTATLVSGPAYGTLTEFNSDGSFTYVADDAHWDTLAQDATEDVTFTYQISDGHGGTDTAEVTITVTGTNDDPAADDDAYNVTEASSVSGNVITDTDGQDSDIDGDSLTATLVGGPTYGTLTSFNSDGSFTYVADGAYLDSLAEGATEDVTFTYQVSDGKGGYDTAEVTITVTGVNDDPVAADDAYNVTEDSSVSGNVIIDTAGQDSDVDGDSLTATLVSGPAYGTLTEFNSDGSFTYVADDDHWDTLAEGETEDITFTYEVSDGHGGTDTAEVTITVTGTNDDPTAEDDDGTIAKPTKTYTTGVLIADPDTDFANLTVAITGTSATGTLTYNGDGTFTYTYDGPELSEGEQVNETFTYTVEDTEGATDNGTITVTVKGTNEDPTASDDTGAITEPDTTYSTGVLITDPDTDYADLSVVIAGNPSGTGTLSYNGDGTFTYTYTGGELSQDQVVKETFTYTVEDTDGAEAGGTITMTVTGVNDAPTAADDSAGITEPDTTYTTGVLITDPDTAYADLAVTIGSSSATGELTYNGDGTFTYTYDGGELLQGQTVNETFTYTVKDTDGAETGGTVTVTVTGVNDDPTAEDDAGTITEPDTTYTTDVVISDPDTSYALLSVDVTGSPSSTGELTYNDNGTFTYTYTGGELAAGQTVNETFTYTVEDTDGATNNGTITVTVTGVNDDPTAADDGAGVGISTDQDTAGTFDTSVILANDTEVDPGDTFAVTGVSGTSSAGGLVTLNTSTNEITYDPNGKFDYLDAGETATDTFTYTITDGHGGTDTATVTVTITGFNDAPTAEDSTVSTDEDVAYTFQVSDFGFNDVDAGDTMQSVIVTDLPDEGTLYWNNAVVQLNDVIPIADIQNGGLVFEAPQDANGVSYDGFAFRVSDGTADSAASYTMTVDLDAVNDAPTMTAPSSVTLLEDTSADITGICVGDVDMDESTGEVRVTLGVDHGILSLSQTSGLTFDSGSNGSSAMTITGTVDDINSALAVVTYTPQTNYCGNDCFLLATDDLGNTGTGGSCVVCGQIDVTVLDVPELDESAKPYQDDPSGLPDGSGTEYGPLSTVDSTEIIEGLFGSLFESGLLPAELTFGWEPGSPGQSETLGQFKILVHEALFGVSSEVQEEAWNSLMAFVSGKAKEGGEQWVDLEGFFRILNESQATDPLDKILLVFDAYEIKLAEQFLAFVPFDAVPGPAQGADAAALTEPSHEPTTAVSLVLDPSKITALDLLAAEEGIDYLKELAGRPAESTPVCMVFDLDRMSLVDALAS